MKRSLRSELTFFPSDYCCSSVLCHLLLGSGASRTHWIVGVDGPVGVLAPNRLAGTQIDLARLQGAHGDGVGHRANRHTQIASNALVFLDLKIALAVFGSGNRLV